MTRPRRCLTLLKNGQRYIFRYAEGREADLLATFVDLAQDRACEFDWHDAAVLSFQMGKRVEWSRESAVT
ncbi:MAG: hypothetical protein IPM64_12035 [Phycisphaerales bacterium]|nr:hypothetical protein [Phycisphaerales bacterium]